MHDGGYMCIAGPGGKRGRTSVGASCEAWGWHVLRFREAAVRGKPDRNFARSIPRSEAQRMTAPVRGARPAG